MPTCVGWVICAFGGNSFLHTLAKILGANDLSPKISSRQLREKNGKFGIKGREIYTVTESVHSR